MGCVPGGGEGGRVLLLKEEGRGGLEGNNIISRS